MSGLNINSPELQALFQKADLNKDGVIDANEQKSLSPQEQSIFNQYNAGKGTGNNPHINIGGNNFGSASTGDKAPSVNTSGTGSPTGVTYGDKSDVNQATGDNSKIITTYQELKIDGETAKLLVDAGFTAEDDIAFIKSKVKDPAFKQLTPEYQQKVLRELSANTNAVCETGVANSTAKIMIKAGAIDSRNIGSLRYLQAQKEFQELSPEQQTLLLENVKHPTAIKSLVVDGEFNNFELGEDGVVKMTSSNHGFELALETDNNEMLRRLEVLHKDGSYEKNGKTIQTEYFNINSAKGELIYRDNPEDTTHTGTIDRRIFMSDCGDGPTDKLVAKNTTQHPMTFVIKSKVHVDGYGNRPSDNDVQIVSYHKSEKYPDQVLYTREYEQLTPRFSDGRASAEILYRNNKDTEVYNLTAGKTYNVHTRSEWREMNSKNLAYHPGSKLNSYIHSTITGLGQPDKIN